MTRCCLCGQPCIPMADYDVPVCYECDDRHEVALARLDAMPPPPRKPWARSSVFGAEAVELAKTLVRPDARPGRPEDIAALLAAFDVQGHAKRVRTMRERVA